MDQCPNATSFRNRVPIYQRENQIDSPKQAVGGNSREWRNQSWGKQHQ